LQNNTGQSISAQASHCNAQLKIDNDNPTVVCRLWKVKVIPMVTTFAAVVYYSLRIATRISTW